MKIMKLILISVMFLLAINITIAKVSTTDWLASYSFDDVDVSGSTLFDCAVSDASSDNGTISGPDTGKEGILNEGFNFTKTDNGDEVAFGSGTEFHIDSNNGFSVFMWVKLKTFVTYEIFSTQHSENSNGYRFGFSGDGNLTVEVYAQSLTRTSNTSINLNEWTFIGWNKNSTGLHFFVNGTKVNSSADIEDWSPPTQGAFLGETLDGDRYDGLMDEMVIFGRALTDSEISELYNEGNGVNACTLGRDSFTVTSVNIYDNTTINTFNVTISNSTFNKNLFTENGSIDFVGFTTGLYDVDISSNESGGYFNRTYVNLNVNSDLEAELFQAIVYINALKKGTPFNQTDFTIEGTNVFNTSNATGGLRLYMNASNFVMSAKATDFFDTEIDLNLSNQGTNRVTVLFADTNFTVTLFAIANGTFINGFSIQLDGINTSFTETLTDTDNPGNVTFSLANNTYDLTIDGGGFALFEVRQFIGEEGNLFNKTYSLAGINSINFSLFDEVTNNLFTENATVTLIGDQSVSNFSIVDGVLHVQNLAAQEYRINYFASKYTQRDFYISIENGTNSTVQLYLLSITNGTDVTFTIQDTSGNDLENATIRLKRYFIESNSYKTVAMARANFEGDAIIDVDFNDAFYETLTTFKQFTLDTIGAKIISTAVILRIKLIPDPFKNVDTLEGIDTNIAFNNVTETFTYTFTNLKGTDITGTIEVHEQDPRENVLVCSATDTTSSGTILCFVNTTLGAKTYTAKGFVLIGGEKILTDSTQQNKGITKTFRDVFETQGDFYTILVAGTMATLGAVVSPAVAIIMFLIGLGTVFFVFGFSILPLTMYMTIVIMGGILIWRMKK